MCIPKEEWMRIINEQESSELSKIIERGTNGFSLRKDKTQYLDIHINSDILVENKGRVDFKPYVVNRYSYMIMK